MGKLGSIGVKRKSVVGIGSMRIKPATKVKFHRQQAVKSLKSNDFRGYRFHSLEVAKLNSSLVIGKMKNKK